MLIASLKKSEDLYRATDQFDLKSCLGHLRSFYEHLHIQAANVLAAQAGGTLTNEFDQAMSLLRNKSLLNPQQEKFARGLYTLISNEGVHALIAEREFARLLRNMVIEYGLLFLTMLEKKGVTLQASNSQTATGMQPGSAPNSIPPASTPL